MRIAIICGGFSEEREASRDSADSIRMSCERMGHEVYVLEYNCKWMNEISRIKPDVAFPMAQGKNHGDGAIQTMLELTGIPYVGSGPEAAAIINHKTWCKKLWQAEGILTPAFFEYGIEEYRHGGFSGFMSKSALLKMPLPLVAKAPTQGGRHGILFIKDECTFQNIKDVFQYDDTLLIEEYIIGRYITQGLLETNGGMKALAPVEMVDDSQDEFKIYYLDIHINDRPEFSQELLAELERTTTEAAAVTGASCYARADYLYDGNKLYLLEINAVPGLVKGNERYPMSDYPASALKTGYEYDVLIGLLLKTAKTTCGGMAGIFTA